MNELDLGLRHDDELPNEGRVRRHRRRGIRTLIALLVVVAVFVGVGVGVAVGVHKLSGAFVTPDYAGNGHGTVVVQVRAGDSASTIGQTLQNKGVVESTQAFVNAARDNTDSRSIQPGYYRLHHHMKADLALALLLNPASRVVTHVTIPEGLTVKQTLQKVASATNIPLSQLQAAAKAPRSLGLPGYAHGHLEGFLYPDTYDVQPGMTATDVLSTMVSKFVAVANQMHLSTLAERKGVHPYDVVKVASLVQREGRVSTEYPKIARVIYNRLHKGMRLQVDASVLYGVGKAGSGKSPTEADLQSHSPYNTYRHAGLPPTPIASPGQVVLHAALFPARGPWLYYVLKDRQGHHYFTANYHSFVVQKQKSQREGIF
jgi:UPF0755 protein